jgi:signal transduction histidine kinase
MPLTAVPELSASWPPGRGLTEPRNARHQVRKALFGWGLGEHAEDAELILSELVANAISHGTGLVETRISYSSGLLRMEVHDNGPGRPVRRGLTVIYGLLDLHGGTLGVEDDADGDGKTVYVSVCLAGGQ